MLKAILIDDEKLALDYLESLLRQTGQVEIAAKLTDVQEGMKIVKSGPIDVVFLDIEMPEISGLEAAVRLLELNDRIEIVFVTAYHEYAVEAFEINALDYLMKPVQPARLATSLQRLSARRGQEEAGKGEEPEVRICCFKRLELMDKAGNLLEVRWRTAKTKELFALLLHHWGRFISKDRIMDILWPDYEYERAITHLHTSIYQIRKLLSSMEMGVSIQFSGHSYRIKLNGLYYDVHQFVEFIRWESGITEDNIGEYERVAALYRDDYLGEDDYYWAEGERVRLKEAFLAMLNRMADFYLKMNREAKAIGCLQASLEKNPFSEQICQELMRVLAQRNDRGAIMRVYETFAQRLMDELGIAPQETTKRLYYSLVAGEK